MWKSSNLSRHPLWESLIYKIPYVIDMYSFSSSFNLDCEKNEEINSYDTRMEIDESLFICFCIWFWLGFCWSSQNFFYNLDVCLLRNRPKKNQTKINTRKFILSFFCNLRTTNLPHALPPHSRNRNKIYMKKKTLKYNSILFRDKKVERWRLVVLCFKCVHGYYIIAGTHIMVRAWSFTCVCVCILFCWF